jgi:hypothetical protein
MTTRMTKADRCDRCGSEAFFLAIKDDLHPLLFCAHHGRKYMDQMISQGWEILDESHRIDKKHEAPANA